VVYKEREKRNIGVEEQQWVTWRPLMSVTPERLRKQFQLRSSSSSDVFTTSDTHIITMSLNHATRTSLPILNTTHLAHWRSGGVVRRMNEVKPG